MAATTERREASYSSVAHGPTGFARALMPAYNAERYIGKTIESVHELACGNYTTRYWTGSDYDFLQRLTLRGRMANLSEPLTAHRFHPNSIKAQQTLKQLRETVRLKRTAYKEYGWTESRRRGS